MLRTQGTLLAEGSSKSGNDIESEGKSNDNELNNNGMQQFVFRLPMIDDVANIGELAARGFSN